MAKRFNIINIISKQAKDNTNEDISQIVADIRNNKKTALFPNFLKIGLVTIAAIFIPIIAFSSPQILYAPYGDGYAVIRYTRGMKVQDTEIIIPDKYKGKEVIAIGEKAFANTKVTNVELPQNLETIKSKAFYNCSSLASIIIPEGVTEIRASAFSHCSSLVEITIPDKVIEINGQTFEYCTSLRRINLHDNIISIHGENFIGCINLDNVILPSKITEIRGNTFEGCTSLSSIIIPEGVTRIGGHAFYGCRKLSYVSVPTTVVEIGSSAFRQCNSLCTIKVPRNALINERAFKESPTTITYYY